MNKNIYQNFTQEELYDVINHIDKKAHPEVHLYVSQLFERNGGLSTLEVERVQRSDFELNQIFQSIRVFFSLTLFIISIVVYSLDLKISIEFFSFDLLLGSFGLSFIIGILIFFILTYELWAPYK